jgi:hypothetical protein
MQSLPPDLEQLRDRVLKAFSEAERQHKAYRPRWEHFFGLWSNYNDTVRQNAGNRHPRDWDPSHRQWWKRELGAELFIPMVFSTVETVVPRAIAQRPRMLVTPRPLSQLPPEALAQMQEAAQHHQLLLDAQQDALHYELILEDIARDGFIFGLGVQKTYWKREYRTQTRLERHIYTGAWCMAEHREAKWDDPFAECVDPFNFFWDPAADTIDTADYAIHRSWRSTKYCLDMVQNQRWNLLPLTEEDIGTGRGTGRRDEVWSARLRALGLGSSDSPTPDQHEVLEFHDGEQVITVLDRQWPVQMAKSPTWHGELPFQVFRPTRVPHRMVGRGEVEPIEDLQDELNTFRTQRLDNATLTLMQSFAYSEGNVDPADVKFGPGMLIPVVGDPREFLFPIPTGTIPNAGYQEMAELKADADRTSGISDVSTGADPSGGVSGTATGAQLVEANAGKRIARKARRLEVEVIASTARQWIAMNQRNILARSLEKPIMPTPDAPDQRSTWVTLTPLELAGEFTVSPEGGASAGDNIPQKRQDVQLLANVGRGDPMLDQRKVRVEMLRKLDIPNPESWISAPPQAPPDEVPPSTLDFLQKAGVPAELIAESVRAAKADQQREQAQQPQGQPQLPPGQPAAA